MNIDQIREHAKDTYKFFKQMSRNKWACIIQRNSKDLQDNSKTLQESYINPQKKLGNIFYIRQTRYFKMILIEKF